MSTSQAEGQPSRRQWLLNRGDETEFPTDGIENFTSFMTDSGFCGMEQGLMVGFTPQDVMSWETYLEQSLTQNERRAIIILSANYATFYNRWNCKPAEDPYREFLKTKGL